ncbi:MAG: type II/IV secretion system protein [Clostridia bacterium]|nr:type II/IV secretion system protein [Clostridia bacterium]
MDVRNKVPIGIELVRRGIISESDINKALEYQKNNPGIKVGDALKVLHLCDEYKLLEAIGDILGEKTIVLNKSDVAINITDYISLDVAKQCMAIPFEISNGKIKVCFADTSNKKSNDIVRLLLLNKGLVMEKYITFASNIQDIFESLEGKATDKIEDGRDVTSLIDNIIKTAINKRASDIHIEPQENSLRIRYRIDGVLLTMATLPKERQAQVIGRLKAISNMHQEKQESQDGRILLYPDYNIRVSTQKNIYGEKFVLRLLKRQADVLSLEQLGFSENAEKSLKLFDRKNSITIVAAPTGEGKTTTLYSIINMLNKQDVNITTIEDPVEIRIPGLNQIEVDPKASFSDSLRTVLRQDPDTILVGEIRDLETAEIGMQAGQTGHYVLSTIHTMDAVEVITRLRKLGISNYDIASTLGLAVSQRLIRRVCPKCAKEREFTPEEIEIIKKLGEKYDVEFDLKDKKTYTAVGCEHCDHTGYYGRIAAFELLEMTELIKELVINDESTIEIRRQAIKNGYRPLAVDGIRKVLNGITTLEELNKKLLIF